MASVAAIFAEIEHRLKSKTGNLAGYTAHYQFTFDEDLFYYISIEDGEAIVAEGQISHAQLMISMSSEIFIALAQGKLDPASVTQAVEDRLIVMEGDLSLAAILPDLLKE